MKKILMIIGLCMLFVLGAGIATAYDVSTCAGLNESVYNDSAIVLTGDIDCAGFSGWKTQAAFTGSIDGNNFTISNLEFNSTSNNGAIFSENGGTSQFSNFCMDNITLSGNIYVGIFWAYDDGAAKEEKVDNVCVKNSRIMSYGTNSAANTGTFFGYWDGKTEAYINNSYAWNNTLTTNTNPSNADYGGQGAIGGKGIYHAKIQNTYAWGCTIVYPTASGQVGGFIGEEYGGVFLNTLSILPIVKNAAGTQNLSVAFVGWHRSSATFTNDWYSNDGGRSDVSASGNISTLFNKTTTEPLASWDFTNTWKLGNNYPIFLWQTEAAPPAAHAPTPQFITPTAVNGSVVSANTIFARINVTDTGNDYMNVTYKLYNSTALIKKTYGMGDGAETISAGKWDACVLKTNGSVQCWDSTTPTTGYTGTDAMAISTHTDLGGNIIKCALKTNGSVQCWGGKTISYTGTDAIGLSANYQTSCVLKQNGSIECWGGSYAQNYSGTDAIAVSTGKYHTCALKANGSMQCWGDNTNGAAINYTGTDLVAIDTGEYHTCALNSTGSNICWGLNDYGQAHNFSATNVIDISAGYRHTCVLYSDGNIDCDGQNSYNETTAYTGGDAVGVSANYQQTCALKSNGSVECWGRDAASYSGTDVQKPELYVFQFLPKDVDYYLNATACDLAGGCGSTETRIYTSTNTAPVLGNPTINNSNPYITSVLNCNAGSYTDADGDPEVAASREWLWYVNNTPTTNTSQTFVIAGNAVKGNNITCRERTYDGYDYSNYANSSAVTVLNIAPVISPAIPDMTKPSLAFWSYDINATDADNDTLTWYINSSLISIDSATGVINDTPADIDVGVYSILVNVSDGSTQVTDSFIYTITDANPPQWSNHTNNATATTKVGGNVQWHATFTDDHGLYYYKFSTNDTGSWTNTSWLPFTGTPSYSNNNYNITLTATKGKTICDKWFINDTSGNQNATNNTCLTVDNSVPVLGNPTINNSYPSIESELNCTAGSYTDADGDTENVTAREWVWYIDGVNSGITTPTLYVGGNVSVGQTVICQERTSDGEEYSSYQNSSGVTLVYDAILTVNAYNVITGLNESTFTIYTSDARTYSTTTNETIIPVTNGTNITLQVSVPGMSDETAWVIPNATYSSYQFNLYAYNSISITIYDEIGVLITQDINVSFTQGAVVDQYVSNLSSLFVSNLTSGIWDLEFSRTGFVVPRTYTITVANNSHQFLDAYLSNSSYNTTFTVTDADTALALDSVLTTMYRSVNGSWVAVESKLTDITGKAQFSYTPLVNYRFFMSKANYTDKIFYLSPILFDAYAVTMSRSTAVLNYSADYEGLALLYSPSAFYNGKVNTFNWLIASPGGLLTDYGFTLTTPGYGVNSTSGANAIGGQLTMNITPNTTNVFDTVKLDYYYVTTLSGRRNFTILLPIIFTNATGSGNHSMMDNQDHTYGLGIFERILIATLVVLFVAGIATMVGQALPGLILALFVFGFMSYIGFVPLWVILPSMFIGVLFAAWKSGAY